MTGLSDASRSELLGAWVDWDQKASLRYRNRGPDLRVESARRIAAATTAADELGWPSGNALQATLFDRRRCGDDYDTAVDHAVDVAEREGWA